MRRSFIVLVAGLVLTFAGCGNPFGATSRSDGTSGSSGTDSGSTGTTTVDSTFESGSSIEKLEDAGFDFATLSGGDSPYAVAGGTLVLADTVQDTAGWYRFISPELDLDMAQDDVVVSFDFRYPNAFPEDNVEEAAKFYLDLTREGTKVYDAVFKPKIKGSTNTGLNHLYIGDADSTHNNGNLATSLDQGQLSAAVAETAPTPWYTATFRLASDGTISFSVSEKGGAEIGRVEASGNPLEDFDGFRFTYRTLDAPDFYTMELDNLSISYDA